MKGKFGIVALLFSSMAFAGPVSTPNNVNDTPIISGGGSVSGGICRAYQTNGTAVNLSGGETLVFYGGGARALLPAYGSSVLSQSAGGFLSTKTTYAGTAYLQVRGPASGTCQAYRCYTDYRYVCWEDWGYVGGTCGDTFCDYITTKCGYEPYTRCDNTYACTHGSAIGLFTRNTNQIQDFIAGAGGAFGVYIGSWPYHIWFATPADGGGWQGGMSLYVELVPDDGKVGYTYRLAPPTVHSGTWFGTDLTVVQGFHGGGGGGGASSISAFYNYSTRDYTSIGTSLTITGGGAPGVDTPTLYVCQ